MPNEAVVTKHLPDRYGILAPDGSKIRLLPVMCGGGMVHSVLWPGQTSKVAAHRRAEEILDCLPGKGRSGMDNAELSVPAISPSFLAPGGAAPGRDQNCGWPGATGRPHPAGCRPKAKRLACPILPRHA